MNTPLRVLIIEDSEDDVLLLLRELRRGGYEPAFERVETAAAMRAALEQQKWDLVIADYSMPRFSGLAALTLLQESGLDLPFILVSEAISQGAAVEAMKAGARDYVLKDDLARLIPVIERELREAAARRERKWAQEALRNVAEGVSAKTGEAFFRLLVQYLGKTLEVDYAFIGELADETDDCIKTIAVCAHGEIIDNFEYNLKHTPCEQVVGQRLCYYPQNVQQDFPLDHLLVEMGIESYIGTPLFDSAGRALGIMVVLDGKPLQNVDLAASMLQIFAVRASAELERRQSEKEIHRRNRELALLNRIIAASAATPNVEPEFILQTACRELALAFDVPQAAATLLNDAGGGMEATVVAEYRPDDRPSVLNAAIPVEDHPAAQHLLTHRTPLMVEDVQNDPRLAPIHDLLRRRGTVSALFVPLVIAGEVAGSLSLGTLAPRRFSRQEIALVQSVADQMAGVLAQARLAQRHQLLSTAIEQASETVLITDVNDNIIYVNPAFERVTGYSPAEVIGRSPHFLASGKHDEAFFQEMRDTINAGQVWRGRVTNKKKDGTLFTEDVTISPIRGKNGEVVNFVEVKRDVTRELELEEQYHQAQKMESIGLLAGGIAHDFNNLLTAINGFAKLLQYELPPSDPRQEMVEKILQAGQRAADLIRQLLAFSRKQIIAPRVLNLNTVVAEMDKMLRRILGEDIVLEIRLAPDLWPLIADPAQMEQVIINLAVNAHDAMPDGGQLTIETANVVLNETHVANHLELLPGDYVRLTVNDTGLGMSEEVLTRIFEPFFTTKEVGKGTGLGLATVFGIVKQNRGDIQVYSWERQGTTFRIYLPRAEDAAAASNRSRQADRIPGGAETVLLVEDDSSVRELASRVLAGQGYTVLEAANGEEALRLAREHNGQIHLLLTDVVMPHMGGKELADRFRVARPQTRVLYASGHTDEAIARRGVLEPEMAFIQKPFSPTALARKVREVLDQ